MRSFIEQFHHCKIEGISIFPGEVLYARKSDVPVGTGYRCNVTGKTCGSHLCPMMEEFHRRAKEEDEYKKIKAGLTKNVLPTDLHKRQGRT